MEKCIVRSSEKFEIAFIDENGNLPLNYVIHEVNARSYFQLAENDIALEWKFREYASFSLKDIYILIIRQPQIQSICDYLNKFSTISKEELEKLYNDAQLNIKTSLEKEIETLKNERALLKDEITKLRIIMKKKEEIFKLIDELKNR